MGILYALFMLYVLRGAFAQQCPPEGFASVDELDLEEFIRARWYSLKQVETFYQPENQFNCVTAQYNLKRPSLTCRFFLSCNQIDVNNSARRDGVDGRKNSIRLQGTSFTDGKTSELFVNFPQIPGPFRRRSNYWVAAVGTFQELPGVIYDSAEGEYDWAIIIAGAPTIEGENSKCYQNGMWMFSRLPSPPEGAILAVDNIAESLGLDSTAWLPVAQEGCNYDD